MPRALWKGASFDLVNVPVELHPAAQSHKLDLTWLDRRSMDPVGCKCYSKSTGEEVPIAEVVKGVKSRAVPKATSFDPADERLAVHVESHGATAGPRAGRTGTAGARGEEGRTRNAD